VTEASSNDASNNPAASNPAAGKPASSNHFALMGGLKQRGKWRVDPRTLHVAAVGGVNLDLTAAELAAPEVELTSVALVGGASLTVPESMRVEISGFRLLGGVSGSAPGTEGGPVLRLRQYSLVGGVSIRRVPDRP
jgi:hypothetical protein